MSSHRHPGRTRTGDRALTALLGLGLVVLGLFALDWRYEVVQTYPRTLTTAGLRSLVESGWWPWVFAVIAVLLALLALAWLVAHLPSRPGSRMRLAASGPTGRLVVDTTALARAAADQLADLAPVTRVTGTAHPGRGSLLVELHAHLDTDADPDVLVEATRAVAGDLDTALPDEAVALRVVVDGPRRTRTGRPDTVRVDP